MRGFVLKLPDLKLGENWIFIFQPMDKVRVAEIIEFYSFWGFNLCKFSMVKNTNLGSQSPGYTLEFVYTLAHCLRFNTKQGFKGAEFLNLQRISLLGEFTCKTIPDEATIARHQNTWRNGYRKRAFFICLRLLGTAMALAPCQGRSRQSSVGWDESVFLDSHLAQVCASLVHSTPPRAYPPAHQGQGLVSEIRAILQGDPEHQADITLFVIISSGWDF